MKTRIPSLLLLSLLALPLPARAADTTIDLPALRAMVANLGYEDSSTAKEDSIFINSVNNSDYGVNLRVARDKTFIYLDIPLTSIPKAKLAAQPLSKLLINNDQTNSYFAMRTDGDGSLYPVLIGQLFAGNLTPQRLRAEIDSLVADANDSKDLWDFNKWPAATVSSK